MTLVKRIRRKAMGGRYEVRIYDTGRVRIRVDHPSNSPEIEFAMAGRLYAIARDVFAAHGVGAPVISDVRWQDDPE